MAKEEVEPMLGEGLLDAKLQEPYSMMNEWNGRGCLIPEMGALTALI